MEWEQPGRLMSDVDVGAGAGIHGRMGRAAVVQ